MTSCFCRKSIKLYLVSFLSISILFAAGCGGNKPDPSAQLAKPSVQGPPSFGQGISGYNEPLEWKNRIGLRAVAQDNVLLISVKNNSAQPVFVEPDAFRMVMTRPESLYKFEKGREDLSGFVARNVAPGEGDLFTVGLPKSVGDPVGLALVFNYPPADTIMRAFIEPTSETVIRTDLGTVKQLD